MTKVFCPICGNNHVTEEVSPNGGWLYVAEEMNDSIDFYDEIIPYKCSTCSTVFYVSESK